MFRTTLSGVALLGATMLGASAHADANGMLMQPALSDDHLAFVYAGDIWVADKDGKNARRLTSHPADELMPTFSPDGKQIAFSASYHGNRDVYVVSVDGGQATRLTWHPSADTVTGWSPDGKQVAFTSSRERGIGRSAQLWHVPASGGAPVKQMEAPIFRGAYDKDAEKLAYMPYMPAYNGLYGFSSGWRGHEGGTQPAINILDLEGNSLETIDGGQSNNINPLWIGDTVYFLSDRDDNKVLNIYRYADGSVEKVSDEDMWDIRWFAAEGSDIVYEAGGKLKSLNARNGRSRTLEVNIAPDLPQLMPGWKPASRALSDMVVSPTGKRVLVTARGEVFSVPTKDGSTRNLSDTDGVREYTALWSPKGGSIAFVEDNGSGQSLVITDQSGLKDKRRIALPDGPNFYFLEEWSSDGSYIVFIDNHLNIHHIDLESEEVTRIGGTERRRGTTIDISPDSRYVVYSSVGATFHSDVKIYDTKTGETHTLTDGMAHSVSPAFSHDGKHLFFAASTNVGPQHVGLDMSSQERPNRFGLYAVVLKADGKSPLLPKPGDEKSSEKDAAEDENGDEANEKANEKADEKADAKEEAKDDKEGKAKDAPASIDFDGLSDRIVALPVDLSSYTGLAGGKDGALYFIERSQPGAKRPAPGSGRFAGDWALKRFDFKSKKAATVTKGVFGFEMAHDGVHMALLKPGNRIVFGKAGKSMKPKPVNMSDVRIYVDPKVEWAQILNDVWRMEASYFYDPNMHGLDWDAVYERYKTRLPAVGRREDLNTLIVEMIGEMQVGHNRAGGGDVHREPRVSVGLLGANLEASEGLYKISKVFTGESWNPFLTAPLAAPGIGAGEGDYILAVNGARVTTDENIYAHFEGTVNKQVTLTVSSAPDGSDPRDVIVEPTRSEATLRQWAEVERRRKRVEEATDGRVGYVYLPNTGGAGFTFFNRMFFAQIDKEAMIIDERTNGGGQAANYITDVLSRPYLSGWKDRDGRVFNTPGGGMYGPMVMLIDEGAGSGGDFLPYAFKRLGLGKLIGTRTWGGLIGISANPSLIDGGFLTVPFFRFFTPDNEWRVENEGVSPDLEVTLDPVAFNAGTDAQLEAAIADILRQLEGYQSPELKDAPPFPTEVGQ